MYTYTQPYSNEFGQGSLFETGSRFNHSCDPNCVHMATDPVDVYNKPTVIGQSSKCVLMATDPVVDTCYKPTDTGQNSRHDHPVMKEVVAQDVDTTGQNESQPQRGKEQALQNDHPVVHGVIARNDHMTGQNEAQERGSKELQATVNDHPVMQGVIAHGNRVFQACRDISKVCLCVCACAYICVCLCVCMYVCMCVCMYACMYVCTYIYI